MYISVLEKAKRSVENSVALNRINNSCTLHLAKCVCVCVCVWLPCSKCWTTLLACYNTLIYMKNASHYEVRVPYYSFLFSGFHQLTVQTRFPEHILQMSELSSFVRC